ncbi:hypothetical protein SAMN04487951_110150 [Vreelandella arcis]|uniref:Uncharacterized protein n=1 Tax=Vreelandella arcis TaxID=416873 RepID=A0A1H0FTG9_9GAMM|nr:hypothetical protein SAMN04487951_110150 [Halomonas arcis]
MNPSDYPLSEVPFSARKGLLSTSAVLLGFTFFTATMWAGGTLGQAFSIGQLLWIIVIGNLLLGAYAAALAYIACQSGLTSVLMAIVLMDHYLRHRGKMGMFRSLSPSLASSDFVLVRSNVVDIGKRLVG